LQKKNATEASEAGGSILTAGNSLKVKKKQLEASEVGNSMQTQKNNESSQKKRYPLRRTSKLPRMDSEELQKELTQNLLSD